MYIADAIMAKEIDRYTIEEIGIPSMVLMENASRSVVKNIVSIISKKNLLHTRILIVAGKGNNGGDGICVARILYELGYDVNIYLVNNDGNFTKDMSNQINIARKCGVVFVDDYELEQYDIIIDAIFGIGLTKDIGGKYYNVIEDINRASKLIISIDIPSGINASTGKVMGIAIKANYTITFGINKIGLILYPGHMYAGQVIVEDIGFANKAIEKACSVSTERIVYRAYNIEECFNSIPKRVAYSNKGTYGKVLVIAGSYNMAGACYLSARAAYKMGAGLVKIFTVEDNRQIIQSLVPEAVLSTYNVNEKISVIENRLLELLQDIDVIVLGPGLGTSDISKQIVKTTLNNKFCSCVVDADAINILSNLDIEDRVKLENVILTPHLKELSRLIHKDMEFVKDNIYKPSILYNEVDYFNKEIDNNSEEILVIKDAITVTINNKEAYLNTSGNNGLATAGAGDVLTGIIAGLVAGGCSNMEAASLGVYIHGLCADEYVKECSTYSLNATDIIRYLEKVLGGILDEKVL